MDQQLEEARARGSKNVEVVGEKRAECLSLGDMFGQRVIYKVESKSMRQNMRRKLLKDTCALHSVMG